MPLVFFGAKLSLSQLPLPHLLPSHFFHHLIITRLTSLTSLTPFVSLSSLFSHHLHANSELICLRPTIDPFLVPVSQPLTMALADETKRVISQFEFSDAHVNEHVEEFLAQMST